MRFRYIIDRAAGGLLLVTIFVQQGEDEPLREAGTLRLKDDEWQQLRAGLPGGQVLASIEAGPEVGAPQPHEE